MAKYRKRPVPVDAFRWQGEKHALICTIAHKEINRECDDYFPHVHTLEGIIAVNEGYWIVTGPMGETWPVQDYVFEKTYELIED